jgi:hypothetical protein
VGCSNAFVRRINRSEPIHRDQAQVAGGHPIPVPTNQHDQTAGVCDAA